MSALRDHRQIEDIDLCRIQPATLLWYSKLSDTQSAGNIDEAGAAPQPGTGSMQYLVIPGVGSPGRGSA